MKRRRIISAVSAFAVLAAAMSGCAGGESEETPPPIVTTAVTSALVTADAEGNYESGVKLPSVTAADFTLPENDGLKMVKDMKIGWCLGNSLDAVGASGLAGETAWGNPTVTADLITTVKAAGFNTLRLPVSWHDHVSGEDFTIEPEWLDRVEEIIGYAYANDMYVILNVHHDTDKAFAYPDYEHLESSKKYLTAVWSQIAAHFADYDHKLIFEMQNEPRLIGTQYEWNFNPNIKEYTEAQDCINQQNQVILDTIRASGGKNADRYVMVPGYAATVDSTLSEHFKLPTDSAEGRLIVSVHAYTPYNFAMNENGGDNFTQQNEVTGFMDRLYDKFTSKGIPVVIGETGAINKDNLQQRMDWAAFFVANARARGMSCCVWDNNAFKVGSENFGLYQRLLKRFRWQELIDAYMLYS